MNLTDVWSVAGLGIRPGIVDQLDHDGQKTSINSTPNQGTRTGTDQIRESQTSDSDELCEVTECCVDKYEFENKWVNFK